MRTTSLIVAGLLAAAPLAAQQEPVPPPQEPRVHVVREGDTLWEIARRYLDDPFLWPDIFRINTDVVENPALIYPRERLVLPDGITPVAQPGEMAPSVFARPTEPEAAGSSLRFGPDVDRPVVDAGDFRRAGFVAHPGEVHPVGRFVAPVYRSVIQNRLMHQVNMYDRIFVRVEDPAAVRPGDRLNFVQVGRRIDRAGNVFLPTAIGTVADIDGYIATVVVIQLFDRLEIGHLALPEVRFPVSAGVRPVRVEGDVRGQVLAFQTPAPLQATQSIVFLTVGRSAGVSIGDVFEAYSPPAEEDWGIRQPERIARMQVVKVTEGTASARVTDLEAPALEVGLPVLRVGRMP